MKKDIRKIANEREKIHENHASSRPLSDDYEYVGLKGEEQFAKEFDLELDRELRPGGDKGIDFITIVGRIDVKTARKPYNLIVEEDKVKADIYVLAIYRDYDDDAVLLGWAFKDEVLNAPVKDFGYGIMNHYISRKELHPIEALKVIVSPEIAEVL